jgi:hypothetical protein
VELPEFGKSYLNEMGVEHVLRNGKYSGTIFLNERSFVKCRTPAVPKAKPNK